VGFRINQGRKGVQDALNFLIAGRDLLLGTIIEGEGLGEREDMFLQSGVERREPGQTGIL
jgi:hypothetical protein